MNRTSLLFLILISYFLGTSAEAQVSQQERLSGFAEHQKDQRRFEEARQKGERAYYEEVEMWESQKSRTLEEYKKQKKQATQSDDGPEAKADAAAKKEYANQYEQNRRSYAKKRAEQNEQKQQELKLPTEAEELGIAEQRPRYDYRKRALFGGTSKFGNGSGGGSSSSGGSRGGFGSGGTSFPPPPTFDDFGGDGGYVPAPNMPEDYGDVPPPPPPPPPFGDEPGGFTGEGMDYPVPPPPPPTFGDEGGF